MFNVLIVTWASVTLVLVGLLIFRALIGLQEDDQLFLAPGREHAARAQQAVQARISKVNLCAVWLGALSGVLLTAVASAWVYADIGQR
jgi:hypothetical protein